MKKKEFKMREGMKKREKIFVKRWEEMKIYKKMREKEKERKIYVINDGKKYEKGNINIGNEMKKIMKEVIKR